MKQLLSAVSLIAIMNTPSFGSYTPSQGGDDLSQHKSSQMRNLNTAKEIEDIWKKGTNTEDSNDLDKWLFGSTNAPIYERLARNAAFELYENGLKSIRELLKEETVISVIKLKEQNPDEILKKINQKIRKKIDGKELNAELSKNFISSYKSEAIIEVIKLVETTVEYLNSLRDKNEISGTTLRTVEQLECTHEEDCETPEGWAHINQVMKPRTKHHITKHTVVTEYGWKAIKNKENNTTDNPEGINSKSNQKFSIKEVKPLNVFKIAEGRSESLLDRNDICPAQLHQHKAVESMNSLYELGK